MSDAYPIGAMDAHLHPALKPNKVHAGVLTDGWHP